jgi:hypothetical protein
MTKDKPLLHLVSATNDPGLHSEELAWFFQALDADAGNRSALGNQLAAAWNGINATGCHSESNFYTDQQAGWPDKVQRLDGSFGASTVCLFRRGRTVWRALKCLEWEKQGDLTAWYEPRQYFPPGVEPVPVERVRVAHGAYYEARGADNG